MLFPHQKQALAWMIARENSKQLPPFWKEETINGRPGYFNSATNFATTTRPSCVLGGVLADDMGLGKTLEVISLIVTNFYNGKPLVTLADRKTQLTNVSKVISTYELFVLHTCTCKLTVKYRHSRYLHVHVCVPLWRHSGIMDSALNSGLSSPARF